MSTNKFLTTRTTSLASLSAVAYGTSSYFYFVQDQLRGSHPLYDLNRSRPSTLVLDMLGSSEVFTDYAQLVFNQSPFTLKILALYPHKLRDSSHLADLFLEVFLREIDNLSGYGIDLGGFLEECLEITVDQMTMAGGTPSWVDSAEFSRAFISGLGSTLSDMSKFKNIAELVLQSPETKISEAPSDVIVRLRKGLSTEYNHRGLTKSRVEIPIMQWRDDYAYRDMPQFESSKSSLVVMENYDGYSLEQIESPEVTNGLGTEAVLSQNVTYGAPPPSNRLSEGEQRVINFDLVNATAGVVQV